MLTPCIGFWVTPLTCLGCGSPAASRMVGATSMTWVNWWRSSPVAWIPRGQWTMVPWDPLAEELGCLQLAHPAQGDDLVEDALERPLGGGAVVADDHVQQGVVEHIEPLQGRDEPAHVVVGVLQEPGVVLHLAGQHRPHLRVGLLPGRDEVVAPGQLGVLGDDAQFLLPGEGPLAQGVPAVVEPAWYLSAHSLGTWWGAWVALGA
jgi:hypothetical protein